MLAACGGANAAPETPAPPAPDEEAERQPESVVEAVADDDRLALDGTFGQLVELAQRRTERGERNEGPCIFRRDGAHYRVVGDLSAGLRPLPAPPETIDLGPAGPLRVFTAWGQYGEGQPVLASLSGAPPPRTRRALVGFVRASTIDVRTTDGSVGAEGLDNATFVATAREALETGARIFLTAERSLPIRRLMEVHEAMSQVLQRATSLALVLPPDLALPSPPPPGDSDTGLCRALEPHIPGAPGQLDAGAAREALSGLSSLQTCLSGASPESAAGGRVEISLVIDAGGTVTRACAEEDGIGDSGVRGCILDRLRELSFPAPGGEVQLRFPLRLEPDRSEAPQLFCN
ncbi:MAG: hypothetical protein AAF411_21850 [Myxococcota bacterium]